MKINKKLFEDVLSGKLIGTFVSRDKRYYSSSLLCRNYGRWSTTHPYCVNGMSYSPNGFFSVKITSCPLDIIDFIPDTNMKENELTIEIPSGKTVDWDESKKQNKIVLKDKQLTYEDICKKLFVGNDFYYICTSGSIGKGKLSDTDSHFSLNANNAPNEHQLECILAKNKLANVAKYLNDGWKPDASDDIAMIIIGPTDDIFVVSVMNGSIASNCGSIWFKTEELAQQAIEILGEETIKLALEPLGV